MGLTPIVRTLDLSIGDELFVARLRSDLAPPVGQVPRSTSKSPHRNHAEALVGLDRRRKKATVVRATVSRLNGGARSQRRFAEPTTGKGDWEAGEKTYKRAENKGIWSDQGRVRYSHRAVRD
jgi:hypothetical protein